MLGVYASAMYQMQGLIFLTTTTSYTNSSIRRGDILDCFPTVIQILESQLVFAYVNLETRPSTRRLSDCVVLLLFYHLRTSGRCSWMSLRCLPWWVSIRYSRSSSKSFCLRWLWGSQARRPSSDLQLCHWWSAVQDLLSRTVWRIWSGPLGRLWWVDTRYPSFFNTSTSPYWARIVSQQRIWRTGWSTYSFIHQNRIDWLLPVKQLIYQHLLRSSKAQICNASNTPYRF